MKTKIFLPMGLDRQITLRVVASFAVKATATRCYGARTFGECIVRRNPPGWMAS
jgi:hypothetical protein